MGLGIVIAATCCVELPASCAFRCSLVFRPPLDRNSEGIEGTRRVKRVQPTRGFLGRLFRLHRPSSALRFERGAAINEFVIAIPFLSLMITAVLDVGSAINEYMLLSEAAHQGVRMASGTVQLTSLQEFQGLTSSQGCAASPAAPAPIPADTDYHTAIQQRVADLLQIQNTQLDPTSLCIKTGLVMGTTPTGALQKNVYVRIEVRYKSFFPAFNGLPMKLSATAPFLQ